MMMHKVMENDIEEIVGDIRIIAHHLSGKTLVLTGGAGFLGKYLVMTLDYLNKKVLDKPCTVIVLDNYITGIKNFGHFQESIKFVEHDITIPYVYDKPIHYIIHAAGIASPVFYKQHKIETIKVGTIGTLNMLEIAKQNNVQSFLLFSSSEVYGDPDPRFVPTPETYFGNVNCIGARACYDESKRMSETMAMAYFEKFHTPIKILRPFNVFGPGMRLDDWRVMANFVKAALEGRNLTIYGEGNQTRTFCYITDAIVGIFKVLLSDRDGEAFNIGNDYPEISMNTLANLIVEQFDNKVKAVHVIGVNDTYTKADPCRRCPVLDKIRNQIGYEAKITLEVGISRFIEWAKDDFKTGKYN